jgi:hypothetical protein
MKMLEQTRLINVSSLLLRDDVVLTGTLLSSHSKPQKSLAGECHHGMLRSLTACDVIIVGMPNNHFAAGN